MVATTAAIALLALLLALGVPLAIWLLVESETNRTQAMDRESAARLARGGSEDDRGHSSRDDHGHSPRDEQYHSSRDRRRP